MTIKNRSLYQSFPFHLVNPSPWPIYLSFSLLASAIGAVMSFHGYLYGGELLSIGLMLVIGGMALWFRDIIFEATFSGDHTKEVKSGLVIGMLLFIISEVFAFLSIFWAFFHSSLSPAVELGSQWPRVLMLIFILINIVYICYGNKKILLPYLFIILSSLLYMCLFGKNQTFL